MDHAYLIYERMREKSFVFPHIIGDISILSKVNIAFCIYVRGVYMYRLDGLSREAGSLLGRVLFR